MSERTIPGRYVVIVVVTVAAIVIIIATTWLFTRPRHYFPSEPPTGFEPHKK